MFKKLRLDILASIKNKKINVFILFLLLSFIILLFTKLSKSYTKTIAFNIEKVNVPQEDVILNDSTALYITLKTSGFKWLTYYFSKPKIKIDFSKDVHNQDSVFIWNKSMAFLENTQFGSQVQLLNITPETLVFRYGINMVKKVPVVLHSDIKFSAGYDVSKPFVLQPDSVVVVGPKNRVSSINSVVTQYLALSNIRTNISETVKLKLPKKNKDLTFSNTEVVLKAVVEKFTEGTLKIPVSIINVPETITLKYFPKEVNVSYYVSLDDYKTISPTDFKVVCDFGKVIGNQSVLVPELVKVPKNVKNATISQKRIEFIIIE
ncbi:CdaR family protein [Mariniflexile maritimum]|uniref:CdaR family protein n=1 Tax=Mariniflexile maritimum TaxID=2682493 RepID=UPI0012F6F79B|nr:YbbR-like domain-containing protein [Mariniflexile maritimum]